MNEGLTRMVAYLIGDGTSYFRMMSAAEKAAIKCKQQVENNSRQIERISGALGGYASAAMNKLTQLKRTMMSLGGMGLGSVGAGMLPALLGFGGTIAAGAGIGWAVNLAADAESAQISFEVMLQSASAAKKMLADLNRFAADTPFEMPQLRNATQMMLQYGITQDKIMPALKALGDIAQGDGQKLHGLAYAFSQVKSVGRLMGQDKNQMVGWGFNPLEAISKMTGKSMQQVTQMMGAGQISFEMVEKAMIHATGPTGRFFEGMLKGSRSTKGLMSTMADTIKLEVTKIGETMIEKLDIKGILTKAIAGAAVVGPMISRGFAIGVDWALPKIKAAYAFLASTISSVITTLSPYFKTAWEGVTAGAGYVIDIFNLLKANVDTFKAAFWSVIEVGYGFIIMAVEWVKNNQDVIINVATAVAAFYLLTTAIGATTGVIGVLVGVLTFLLNPLVLIPAAIAVGIYYLMKFTETGKWASAQLQKAFVFVGEQFKLLADLIRAGEFETAWTVVTTSLTYAWEVAIASMNQAWIQAKALIASTWYALNEIIIDAFGKTVGIILSDLNRVIEAYNLVNIVINPALQDLPLLDTNATMAAIETVKQGYKDAQVDLIGETQRGIDAAQAPADAARAAWEAAQKEAKRVQEEVNKPKGGKSWVQMAFEFGGMGVDQLKKFTDPMAAEATVAGTQVGNNFTGAVQSAMGSLDAVKAGTTKAYDVLTAYQNQMKPSTLNQNITQATTPKQEELGLFGQMATGIGTLVEQGKTKFTDLIGPAILGG